jgi:DNA ligase IV
MHFTIKDDVAMIAANVDEYGDSYCRDVTVNSLKKVSPGQARSNDLGLISVDIQ